MTESTFGRTAYRSFRGFTAPASLKAIGEGEILGADGRFRGFTAPASLKAWADAMLAVGEEVSGALPPRPH